jgi:hypothetical protein
LKLRSLLQAGKTPLTDLTNVATGRPAWGVEFRCVRRDGKLLVPMLNLLKSTQTVRLGVSGQARDLLSGNLVDLNQLALEPMRPVLLKIR